MLLQTPILSKTSIQNELFSSEDLSKHFLLSPLIFEFRSDVLFLLLPNQIFYLRPPLLQQTLQFRPSFPIDSERALNLLLASCEKAEKEQQVETEEVLEESSKAKENEAFTESAFHSNNSNSKGLISETESTDIEDEDNWENNANDSQNGKQSFFRCRQHILSKKKACKNSYRRNSNTKTTMEFL